MRGAIEGHPPHSFSLFNPDPNKLNRLDKMWVWYFVR